MTPPTGPGAATSSGCYRRAGRAVAVLVRLFGDIDLAQEAVQDAFSAAVERWPRSGTPPEPAGSIITTAKRRAIDRLRREASREARRQEALREWTIEAPDNQSEWPDDRLRLILTSCHPALALSVQVALTLRLLGGLTTAAIARAFLVPERPWLSGWSGPSARSATPQSRTAFLKPLRCRRACARSRRSST